MTNETKVKLRGLNPRTAAFEIWQLWSDGKITKDEYRTCLRKHCGIKLPVK